MVTYGRWAVLLACAALVVIFGGIDDNIKLFIIGMAIALTCIGGAYIDVFRDREIRGLKEELIIHRRTEAARRDLNQRRRHP